MAEQKTGTTFSRGKAGLTSCFHARTATQPDTAVLFSGGLDSAVLLADEARASAVPLYVSTGLAWESTERAIAARLLASPPFAGRVQPLVPLEFTVRDLYSPAHWAIRGVPPAYDT